jgi:alpha-glucosidase
MQWNGGDQAGFSDAEPWLPLLPGYKHDNVANQRRDPTSIYCLCRRLTGCGGNESLVAGRAYRPVAATGDVFVFFREFECERIAVTLNLGDEATAVSFRFDFGGPNSCFVDGRPGRRVRKRPHRSAT